MYNLTHQIKSAQDPDEQITVTEPIYTVDDFPYDDVFREILSRRKNSSAHSHYLGDFATFDIETSTYIEGYKDVTRSEKLDPDSPDNPKHHKTKTHHEIVPEYNAFMYICQIYISAFAISIFTEFYCCFLTFTPDFFQIVFIKYNKKIKTKE